eukprot:7191398-Prymnesium_polylepis.1
MAGRWAATVTRCRCKAWRPQPPTLPPYKTPPCMLFRGTMPAAWTSPAAADLEAGSRAALEYWWCSSFYSATATCC